MIKYKDKEYRTVDLHLYSEDTGRMDVTIADETLLNAFSENGTVENWYKGDAKRVDDEIYFYVGEGVLDLPEEEIAANHLDEPFQINPDYEN